MANIAQLLTEHMEIWTGAETEKKSGRGRASGNGGSVYGVKKLRELILELAVRGKLVPQDSNDEPASELLKRIQAEKAKLIAEGKLKKEKPLSPITDEEKPFELPRGWEWVNFGDIAQHNSGKTLDKGRNKGVFRGYITTSNVYWGTFELENVKQMPIEESELERCTAQKGDLLICEGGEAGRAAVWTSDNEVCFQNHVHRARMYGNISPFYAYRYFEKLNASGEIEQYRKGVGISNMSGKALASVKFALPPLSEQHRIVAKVDELMALCDQLEQQHSNAQEAHETLVSQLLATLTQSQNAAEFNANWQRIDTHFDLLFTTEASIDVLKQTLLQLAVMGKLVPQDPDDEPASELLKRIQAEKAKMIAEGKLKKEKPLHPITGEEIPFELPQGWEWVRFGDALVNRDAERIPISSDIRQTRKGEYDYYGASGVIDKVDSYIFDKPLLLIGEDGANLLNRTTPIAFIARGKYWVNNHAHVLDGLNEQFLKYIGLCINAIDLSSYVTGTAQPKMNQAKMNSILLGLPPENEQHRIVAKVDALMALCDQLKTRLQHAGQQQQAIADALVARAVQ